MQLIEVNCPYQLQLQFNSKHAASLHDSLSARVFRLYIIYVWTPESIILQPSHRHDVNTEICHVTAARMQLHVRRAG